MQGAISSGEEVDLCTPVFPGYPGVVAGWRLSASDHSWWRANDGHKVGAKRRSLHGKPCRTQRLDITPDEFPANCSVTLIAVDARNLSGSAIYGGRPLFR